MIINMEISSAGSTAEVKHEESKQAVSYTDQQISDFVRDLISECKNEVNSCYTSNLSIIKNNINNSHGKATEVINYLHSKANELEEAFPAIQNKLSKAKAYKQIALDLEQLCNERTKCYNEIACTTFDTIAVVAIPLCGIAAAALTQQFTQLFTQQSYLASGIGVITSLAVAILALNYKISPITNLQNIVNDIASQLETLAQQHLPRPTVKLLRPNII